MKIILLDKSLYLKENPACHSKMPSISSAFGTWYPAGTKLVSTDQKKRG
jgi:hypothetical protein